MPPTDGVIAARPTLAVSGDDRPVLGESLQGLHVVENLDGLARCEALFGNWGEKDGALDTLFFDRSLLDFGKPFVVKIGRDTVFEGRITAIEGRFGGDGKREIQVFAEDRLQDLRMTRRTRTFEDLTDADLVRRVAGDHGLTPDVALEGPKHRVLAQVNQSDLAFLRDRLRAVDGEVWVESSTLHAKTHASRVDEGGTPPELSYQGNLREFTVMADLAHQRTSVAVSGWDVSGKSAVREEAGSAAVRAELDGGQSGADVLASALAERKESVAHSAPLTSAEAKARAEAVYRRIARRFVVGHGLCEADARLRAGKSVTLSGLGPLFNGKYCLAEVRFVFSHVKGIHTEFTAERPGLGRP